MDGTGHRPTRRGQPAPRAASELRSPHGEAQPSDLCLRLPAMGADPRRDQPGQEAVNAACQLAARSGASKQRPASLPRTLRQGSSTPFAKIASGDSPRRVSQDMTHTVTHRER